MPSGARAGGVPLAKVCLEFNYHIHFTTPHRYGMVCMIWYAGMVWWYGIVWYSNGDSGGMVWYGMVWSGVEWCGML